MPCLGELITAQDHRLLPSQNQLYNPLELKELIVEDAPLLEKLISRPPNDGLVIRIHAPKMKTLGCLHDDIHTFELGNIVFKVALST